MLQTIDRDTEKRMEASVELFRRDLGKVRTGRASLALLDGVMVSYYGTATPLNQVAKLGIPEPSLITAQPFDPSSIADIEKGIRSADLGLNPGNDGKIIRIPIPPLTEERRKELVKQVGQLAEEARTRIRLVRREANDEIKALEKDHQISQDEEHRAYDRIQKIHDDYIGKIEELAKAKETDLMEV
jgi:ribosome recycling factor